MSPVRRQRPAASLLTAAICALGAACGASGDESADNGAGSGAGAPGSAQAGKAGMSGAGGVAGHAGKGASGAAGFPGKGGAAGFPAMGGAAGFPGTGGVGGAAPGGAGASGTAGAAGTAGAPAGGGASGSSGSSSQAGATGTAGAAGAPAGCPDGACNNGETCATCPQDCGVCAPTANDDPSRLLVYTINYENLMTPTSSGDPAECQGDWTELIDQIAGTTVAPDVVLIQQMSGKDGFGPSPVETVEAALAKRFPGQSWNTIIAETQPSPWANANCPGKSLQTNGIMYRVGRLDYVTGTKKTLMARISDNGGCPEALLSRNLAVFGKFGDKPSGKEVALGAVHWPVEDGCGVTNATLTDELMMTYTGAQLYIWGGDVNLHDRDTTGAWMPWYAKTNAEIGGSLGYREPVFGLCGGQPACLDANATLKVKRYDFLFAKYKPAYKAGLPQTAEVWTVPWDPDGDNFKYSMHKAVKSYVYW